MLNHFGVTTESKYAIAYIVCLVFFLAEATVGIVQLTSTGFSYAYGSFINSGPYSCFLEVMLPNRQVGHFWTLKKCFFLFFYIFSLPLLYLVKIFLGITRNRFCEDYFIIVETFKIPCSNSLSYTFLLP